MATSSSDHGFLARVEANVSSNDLLQYKATLHSSLLLAVRESTETFTVSFNLSFR